MDLVHDRTSNVAEEEDRISKLPDDIIHRILSFLDMKYAVQTSAFSKRWKFTWTSMPDLNLNFQTFGGMPMFAKFVKHVLSHRNKTSQVSAVKLTFRGLATGFVVNRVVDYAYTHNIRKMTMIWFAKKVPEIPLSVFRSQTLKHLNLKINIDKNLTLHKRLISELPCVPESAWDLPTLETLNLSYLKFRGNIDKNLNLFSKCVNLKDLTLHKCYMLGLDVFNICAPELLNLTITDLFIFPKVFNLVAPQLENLTASVKSISCYDLVQLSTCGLDSLEKVNLLIPSENLLILLYENYFFKNIIAKLLDLFQKLCSAKFLIINSGIIQVLSLYLNQELHEPCPFTKLKCLKIDMLPLSLRLIEKERITKMVPQVINYFLEYSPKAIVIDLIQVSPERVKRPRSLVDSYPATNKVAKLDLEENKPETRNLEAKIQMLEQVNAKQKDMFVAKIQMQDEVIAEQKTKVQMQDEVIVEQKAKIKMQDTIIADQKARGEATIQMQDKIIADQKARGEATIQMQDKIIADQKARGEATIQMQDEGIAEQKDMFVAKIQMQDEVIAKQKAMFEAKIQMQDEGIAELKAMFDAKIQMQDEVIANQKDMFVAKIQMQDEVIAQQKAKIQMQGENIAKQKTVFDAKIQMIEAAKLQQERLTSLVIKCKIAEFKVQLESGNPDYEFIRSIGSDIKSVMDFIPESLRVAMETQFSFQYVELKSLFFTRFDASQWAKIETELGYTRDSQTSHVKVVLSEPHVPAAKLLPAPKPPSSNRQIATSLIVVMSESQTGQASKNSRE